MPLRGFDIVRQYLFGLFPPGQVYSSATGSKLKAVFGNVPSVRSVLSKTGMCRLT